MTRSKNPNHRPRRSVGVWIRVSTENQAAGDSPETHEHRARGFATAKDWEVVEVYRLSAVSGKNVRDHTECRRMMEDIKSGKIEALIFSKLARLARNTRDLLDFADFFREHEADLVSLKENIDTGSHSGRFFYTMIAGMAQWEREEISSRVKEAVATRAKMGKPLGGSAPFGYQYEDSVLVLHPEEAPVRALMYELFVKTQRIKTVARELNERGYRTRKDSPWQASTIRKLLTDSISKGLRRTNYSRKDRATGKIHLKDESEWVYLQVPAVVSEEVWERVNAVLDVRSEEFKRRPGRESLHLFTGLIRCQCSKKMYVPSRVKHYRCEGCGNSISCADLEGIFLEKLREWLTPETVAAILLQADQLVQDRRGLKESLETQLAQSEADMDTLFGLHSSGEVPTLGFRKRYEPIEQRSTELQKELATIQGELDCYQSELLNEEQALAEAEDLLSNLETMDQGIKRQTVQTLVREIEIGKEEVVLRLNYLPFLSLGTPTSVTTLRGLDT